MLLSVTKARNALIAGLAAASIAIPAAPALALSEKDKAFVAGVATAVIVDELLKQGRIARESRRAPRVVYADPAPVYVDRAPVHGSTSIYATPAARAFPSYSLSERKAIQRNLRAWGYYRSSIDGKFGPGTYNAITAYARDEGVSLRTTASAYGVYDGLLY